jgi:hypothetical protein
MLRRILVSFLFVAALLASSTLTAQAAAPTLNGTFTTVNGQGTIKYTMVKALARLGSQGRYVINGKSYPGVLYAIRATGGLGLSWFYGSTGITAGSAVVSPTGNPNEYSGTIQFVDRQGNVIDSGAITITMQ